MFRIEAGLQKYACPLTTDDVMETDSKHI